MLFEAGCRLLDERGRQQRFAALRAVHGGNRNAPRPLTRNAPVRPVQQHVAETVAAPGRYPTDLVLHGVHRRLPQRRGAIAGGRHDVRQRPVVERDEPLRRCEKDHRVVTPPAMRVRVLERRTVPEPSPFLKRAFDVGIGVEYPAAAKQLDGIEKVSPGTDRSVDLEPVLHARVEVIAAMTRRRVYRARSLLQRHVVAEHAQRRASVERMLEANPFKYFTLERRKRCTK